MRVVSGKKKMVHSFVDLQKKKELFDLLKTTPTTGNRKHPRTGGCSQLSLCTHVHLPP